MSAAIPTSWPCGGAVAVSAYQHHADGERRVVLDLGESDLTEQGIAELTIPRARELHAELGAVIGAE